jgi:hypothetical protein
LLRFIFLSPSERFVVLSVFSGQSEERYDLFRVDEGLERVGGVPYQFGEVANYCFSEDEAFLVMALPATCSEWWVLSEDGEPEPGDGEHVSFGFATVLFHNIKDANISVHQVRVAVPADWSSAELNYEPDLHPRLATGSRLLLAMPWGDTEVALPMAPVVTIAVGP